MRKLNAELKAIRTNISYILHTQYSLREMLSANNVNSMLR